jgi:hypothetical protein
VRIFVAVDGYVPGLSEIVGSFQIGVGFTISFTPERMGLTIGSHSLDFFAVDADGDVSEGNTVVVDVTNVPPATIDVKRRTATTRAGTIRPRRTATPDSQEANSGVSAAAIVAIGVVGGVILITVIACLVRTQRRRCLHKVDEKLDDGSGVNTREEGLVTA